LLNAILTKLLAISVFSHLTDLTSPSTARAAENVFFDVCVVRGHHVSLMITELAEHGFKTIQVPNK
jgi:hypothetical protein